MPASAALQVMNLGPAPTDDDVKHEMAHVWQSQHHTDPFQFMRGCVACQAFALALNGQAAQMDPTLVTKTKQGFPEAYPFDAYAYKPGDPFETYGGEQIARQVEQDVRAIQLHVRTAPMGSVDNDNVKSLNIGTGVADWRIGTTKG
jgi:hypothetical protein